MCATPKSNKSLFLRFIRCERGATAIEYALIAAGISVAISAVVLTLGSEVRNDFMQVENVVR
ncbi:MAG: Flp family type IVb pilin [Alphaproteobacteria bacterium]|nr:Flp family type IVb pilin [Alphaproteobacteria bacterium]